MPADHDDHSPDTPALLKRLAELSGEFARQKARAAEAIERVRRNVEITHRERSHRHREPTGRGTSRS
jgi:hypothetical protein